MSTAPLCKVNSQQSPAQAMLNEAIKAPQVRLIDGDSNTIMRTSEALARAKARGLDLVAVAVDANPIVCKLLEYHKEVFKQRQALKEAKVTNKKSLGQVKEIKMKGLIDNHDLETKCAKVAEALKKYHPVRVIVSSNARMMRDRPSCLTELPGRLLEALAESGCLFSVQNQTRKNTTAEMLLMPMRPTTDS
jgi:translation initiation factor IF-3